MSERDNGSTRAPLRWTGSKRALLPTLKARRPARYRRYVEPFVGSGCLYFALRPKEALLGDFNSELVSFYATIKRDSDAVYDVFERWSADAATYYMVRGLKPRATESTLSAARFFYLNRHSFNGVYRTNRLGEFNVPFGSRTGTPPSRDELREAAELLLGAAVSNGDFQETLASVESNDFVYLDPPYVNASRSSYGEYGYGSFGSDDMSRLASELVRLDHLGAKVLFSFGSIAGLEDALAGWSVETVAPRQSVSRNVGSRRPNPTEILARNYSS